MCAHKRTDLQPKCINLSAQESVAFQECKTPQEPLNTVTEITPINWIDRNKIVGGAHNRPRYLWGDAVEEQEL